MENEEILQAIGERVANLQPEIQAVIMSTDYEKNLLSIGAKYNLNKDQLFKLEFETSLVLIGYTHPDEYRGRLDRLELPKEIIDQIHNEVNQTILKSIVDIIKSNFEREDKEEMEYQSQLESEDTNDADKIRNNLKSTVKNNPAQERDFLADLGVIISESTKDNK